MEVIETDGKHWVANGQRRVGPFDTNAAAWSWLDRHGNEGRDDTERYGRIRWRSTEAMCRIGIEPATA